MKLSPLEQAIDRAATRILRKHAKELEAAPTLFYSRAVGQAVEHLNAKTSPAKKANKTRKDIASLKATLRQISGYAQNHLDEGRAASLDVLRRFVEIIDAALAEDKPDAG